MGIFSNLFSKKNNSKVFSNEELVNAGICPNCWGHQAYDDKYVAFVKDQTKSNINHDKENQKAFVQQFIETHLTGIRLIKDGDQQACPACKTKYKQVTKVS